MTAAAVSLRPPEQCAPRRPVGRRLQRAIRPRRPNLTDQPRRLQSTIFLRPGPLTRPVKNCIYEGSSLPTRAHFLQERSIVSQSASKGPSRREVIQTAGGVAVASALAGAVPFVHAAASNTIQI